MPHLKTAGCRSTQDQPGPGVRLSNTNHVPISSTRRPVSSSPYQVTLFVTAVCCVHQCYPTGHPLKTASPSSASMLALLMVEAPSMPTRRNSELPTRLTTVSIGTEAIRSRVLRPGTP